MPKTVIISIGHGKNTWEDKKSKGVVKNGVVFMEHTFNAIVGMKVKSILEAHGVNVVLVQQPNALDVPLSTRTSKAKQIKPDLYWSIHANAGSNQGMAAFYWSTDPKAEKAAELYAKYAKEAGLTLYSDGSYPSVAGTWNDFHELRVNKNNGIVAILTENGFMTHPEDFERIFLNKDDFHNVISKVNARAILSYLGIDYKEEEAKKSEVEEVVKVDGIYFENRLMKKGQEGNLHILKDINLWNPNKEKHRVLKAGEVVSVYGVNDGDNFKYEVGGGYTVSNVKGYVTYKPLPTNYKNAIKDIYGG